MRRIYLIFILLIFSISCSDSQKNDMKLPFYTDFKDVKGWSLDAGAKFDPDISSTPESGSIHFAKAGDNWVMSDRIISDFKLPVDAGKTYTLSFKSRTETFPPPLLEVYGAMSGENGFIENSNGTMCANSQKGVWEENFVVIKIPQNQMIKYFQIKILMLPKHGRSAPIWIDDIRFVEGLELGEKTVKKSFDGSVTRVDIHGNIEIRQGQKYIPFFPIGIYTDENRKDWSIYKKMGFNLNMWASNVPSVRKSKEHGLYSMMQIVQYIVPVDEEWIPQDPKKKIAHLHKTLQSIKKEGLWNDLLFYYVDNEFYHIEKPFKQVIDIVHHEDKNAHPIYMLSGAYGLARMYNDYINLTGTYVAEDGYERPIIETFEVLNHTPNQKQPVVFAQINRGVGKNFKAVVFGAIAKGAKGIGFWRDGGSAGKIEERPVFKQLPKIAKEISQMMPLIRSSTTTQWKVESNQEKLIIGTRMVKNEGYLIIANPESKGTNVHIKLKGFPYHPKRIEDYFSHLVLGNVNNDIVTLTIKPYDAMVVKLTK